MNHSLKQFTRNFSRLDQNSQASDYSLQKLVKYAQVLKKGSVNDMICLIKRIQCAKLDRKVYLIKKKLVDYSNQGPTGLRAGMSLHALTIKQGLDSDPLIDKCAQDLQIDAKVLNYCSSLQFVWSKVKDIQPANEKKDGNEKKGETFISQGLKLHAYGLKIGLLQQSSSLNMMMTFYGKFAMGKESMKIFKTIQDKNHLVYSSIITTMAEGGFIVDEKTKMAIFYSIFGEIVKKGLDNQFTYGPMLNFYAKNELADEALKLFDEIPQPTLQHYTIVILMFGKMDRFEEALDLLDIMPHSKDEILITALLHSCSIHMNIPLGLRLAKELEKLNPNEPAAYLIPHRLLMKDDPERAEEYRRKAIGLKQPGLSLIE